MSPFGFIRADSGNRIMCCALGGKDQRFEQTIFVGDASLWLVQRIQFLRLVPAIFLYCLDKDRACREGFEYVARYFANSLDELKKRHAGLDVDFHRPDADSFTCAVYINGRKVGQCWIWRSNHGMGDICYS